LACAKNTSAATWPTENVEILDPATGTGTFICELLEHFRGQPKKLKRKYQRGTACQRSGHPAVLRGQPEHRSHLRGHYRRSTKSFHNLCFVDTLDNVGLHTAAHGTTIDLFGSVSEENVARIKRQNGTQDQRDHRQPALQRQPGE
jgi:predicted helicase